MNDKNLFPTGQPWLDALHGGGLQRGRSVLFMPPSPWVRRRPEARNAWQKSVGTPTLRAIARRLCVEGTATLYLALRRFWDEPSLRLLSLAGATFDDVGSFRSALDVLARSASDVVLIEGITHGPTTLGAWERFRNALTRLPTPPVLLIACPHAPPMFHFDVDTVVTLDGVDPVTLAVGKNRYGTSSRMNTTTTTAPTQPRTREGRGLGR